METLPATTVSRDFQTSVRQLRKAWAPISDGYAELAKKHLDFAKMIAELWETAKRLDRGTKKTEHMDYMRQQLQELVQTDDKSILSRWKRIGEQASILLTVAEHLPSNRDHLYEIATAVKKEKPVIEWIEMEKIHPGVSVRDIRLLNTDGIRRKSTAEATRTRSVTFHFSSDLEADEIVEILRAAFSSNRFSSISTDKSVKAACQSSLRGIFDELEPKFIDASPPKVKRAASKKRKLSKK